MNECFCFRKHVSKFLHSFIASGLFVQFVWKYKKKNTDEIEIKYKLNIELCER